MARKTVVPRIWYFVAVVATISLLIFDSADRSARDAEKNLEIYRQATTCLNSDPCRQMLQVTVSENKAESYTVNVILPDKSTQSVIIIPDIPINTKYFGSNDIYIPASGDPYFAERYFPAQKGVKVEIWQGQITFIFTDSNKAEDITLNQSPKEIAIPTANHPGVIFILAQRNVSNWLIVEIIVLALTILIAYRLNKFSSSKRKHAIIH
jgi:hypothetical protein